VRLGLFGGTFDPPHIGHLIVAQDALEQLRLDRILFIPAGAPPHKLKQEITSGATRLAMLEAAVGADARFGIETLELERSGPSYTVDTVAALKGKYPGAELVLLIGADQYREFGTWREPARVASMATIAVLSRSGSESGSGPSAGEVESADVGGRYLKVTRIDISSTRVRQRASQGESIRYLVPAAVEAYIGAHRVYTAP
jgi:nicotinate-nucleotide adenylyltransferase